MGDGRFGPLFLADDPVSRQRVVIRTFARAATAGQRDALVASLRSLCDVPLEHPSIARPLAAGIDSDVAYLAHTYLDGVSAAEFLRASGPQPLTDTVARVTQIAAALDFAAAVGVHHGDLTPHDIVIGPQGTGVAGLGLYQALQYAGLEPSADQLHGAVERDIRSLMAITRELVRDEDRPHLDRLSTDVPASALAFAASVQQIVSELAASTAVAAPEADAFLAGASPEAALDLPLAAVEPALSELQADAVEPVASDLRTGNLEQPLAIDLGAADFEPAPAADLRAGVADVSAADVHPGVVEPANAGLRADTADRTPIASSGGAPDFMLPAMPDPSHAFAIPLGVAVALAIGLLTGFASGVFVGRRDAPAPVAAVVPPPEPTATGGRTYTEQGVGTQDSSRDAAAAVPREPDTVQEPAGRTDDTAARRPAARVERTAPREGPARPERAARSERTERLPAGPGALLIESHPSGAEVFVDGAVVGRTPMLLSDVRAGQHAVRLELPTYRGWKTSVDVAAGARTRVAASLEQ